MKYVSKEKTLDVLDNLIQARKKKSCSNRQAAIEVASFEYCKTIINKLDEVEIEED